MKMSKLDNSVLCLCGTSIDYSNCCRLYHIGERTAPTSQALMRSRYCAYALANIEYIKKTMQGKPLIGFDEAKVKYWAESVEWLGLEIISTRNESPERGFVEFIARFMERGKPQYIHEISEFHCIDGQWFYVDGMPLKTHKNNISRKIGRNSPCLCGSHKKFKNCHGKDSTA